MVQIHTNLYLNLRDGRKKRSRFRALASRAKNCFANKLHTIKSVKLKKRSFFARNLSDFVATSVVRSARVQEVPGSNPGGARV